MASSLLLLICCRSNTLLSLLALVIALLSPFLFTPAPLLLSPLSVDSISLFSSFLTTGHIFVLANFIVLAILISSGSLRPFNFFPSTSSLPGFKALPKKGTLSSHPSMEVAFLNDNHSERRAVSPAPFLRQLDIVPAPSQLHRPDQSHLHLVQNLPLATAKLLVNTQLPKPAFVTSGATGARMFRSTSDKGVHARAAIDLRKTLRKAETMNNVSVVFRPLDCDPSLDCMDRLFNLNACLSPRDFNKKCDDFIAKVHLDRKNTF